jgi:hypothetical protein
MKTIGSLRVLKNWNSRLLKKFEDQNWLNPG